MASCVLYVSIWWGETVVVSLTDSRLGVPDLAIAINSYATNCVSNDDPIGDATVPASATAATISSSNYSNNKDDTYQTPTPTKPNPGPSNFYCTWPGCDQNKTFARRSDLTKHVDKHTRPYTCHNPACIDVDFGDKAGLRRHERERHGTAKFFCPISSCRKHVKGFARKRNLDSHIKSRHQVLAGRGGLRETLAEDGFSESSKMVGDEEVGDGDEEMRSEVVPESYKRSSVESTSLQLKLQELEAEKRELEICQSRVDEDILALKRVLQIVSS